MSKQTYYYVVAGIFLVLAVMHLVRAVNGWDAAMGDIVIPMWASWAAVVIGGYLAYQGFQFGRKM